MRITNGSTSNSRAGDAEGGEARVATSFQAPVAHRAGPEPRTAEPNLLRRLAQRLGLEARPPLEPEDVWDAQPVAGYPDVESLLHERLVYRAEDGRVAQLLDKTVVEGTAARGGAYPHCLVDLKHPAMVIFLESVERLHLDPKAPLETATRIVAHLRQTLAGDSAVYGKILRRACKRNELLSLGKLLEAGVGSAREHALLLNLALRHVGVKAQMKQVSVCRQRPDHVVQSHHLLNLLTVGSEQIVVTAFPADLHGRSSRELLAPGSAVFLAKVSHTHPRFFVPTGPKASVAVTVTGDDGARHDFDVIGQTPARRAFRQEAERLQSAAPEDRLTIEWIFAPAYVPLGHTALRIGEDLWELTRDGWNKRDARSYLFHNPFFRSQTKLHGREQAPPMSLGVPIELSAAEIRRLIANLERAKDAAEPFKLLTHNCNSGMLEATELADKIGSLSSYESFSSAFTFRRLLDATSREKKRGTLYLLSGHDDFEVPLRAQVPRVLYDHSTVVAELRRVVLNWPYAEALRSRLRGG